MATIHFIGGEKGGVGKSVVARVLAQYFIDRGIAFTGFDTDRSHGALLRFYTDYAQPIDLNAYDSVDELIEAAVALPEQHILVDLAAQSYDPLAKWLLESGVFAVAEELEIKLIYWHVMDSGQDSVALLARLLDQMGEQFQYVIVQNQLRDEHFNLLMRSGLKEKALMMNAQLMTLKKLYAPIMLKIDAHNASFWAATQRDPGANANVLGILDRQRLKIWLNSAYTQLDRLVN